MQSGAAGFHETGPDRKDMRFRAGWGRGCAPRRGESEPLHGCASLRRGWRRGAADHGRCKDMSFRASLMGSKTVSIWQDDA